MKNLILFTALILTLQTLFGQQVERQLVGSTGKYFSNSKGSMSWSVGELMTATFSTANNAFTQGFQQPDAVCQFSDTEPPLLSDCPGDITSCSPVTAFFPPFVSDNCSLVDVQRTVTTTTTFTSILHTFTYMATDEAGNSAECSFTITQLPLPKADAGNDTAVAAGEPVVLGGNPTGGGGAAPYNYLWNPAGGLDDNTSANPVATVTQTTDFLVFVIDSNGCAGTDNVVVTVQPAADGGQSDKSESDFDAQLFPNPASESVFVKLYGTFGELGNIQVADMLGRKVFENEADFSEKNDFQIEVSKWLPGQYIVQITAGDDIFQKQISIVR